MAVKDITLENKMVVKDTTQVDKELVDRVTILFLSLEKEPLQVGKEEVTIQVGKEIVGRATILENMNEVDKDTIQVDKEVVDRTVILLLAGLFLAGLLLASLFLAGLFLLLEHL